MAHSWEKRFDLRCLLGLVLEVFLRLKILSNFDDGVLNTYQMTPYRPELDLRVAIFSLSFESLNTLP